MTIKKIKVGKKYITALAMPFQSKNLVVLRGQHGYIMCGYLNLKVAEKFNDVAVKIIGVRTINDAISANVYACTSAARQLGIKKGQPVTKILEKIA